MRGRQRRLPSFSARSSNSESCCLMSLSIGSHTSRRHQPATRDIMSRSRARINGGGRWLATRPRSSRARLRALPGAAIAMRRSIRSPSARSKSLRTDRRPSCRSVRTGRHDTSSISVPRLNSGVRSVILSRGLDQRADAGVRDAHHRDFRLDRAHRRHREHLVRRRTLAVPRVVGDIHEHIGAVVHLAPREVGKDALVANQNSELRAFEVEQRLLACRESYRRSPLHDPIDEEAEKRARRNVLAERHQLRSCRSARRLRPCRRDQVRAIVESDDAPSCAASAGAPNRIGSADIAARASAARCDTPRRSASSAGY